MTDNRAHSVITQQVEQAQGDGPGQGQGSGVRAGLVRLHRQAPREDYQSAVLQLRDREVSCTREEIKETIKRGVRGGGGGVG